MSRRSGLSRVAMGAVLLLGILGCSFAVAGFASADGWGPLAGTDDLGRTLADYSTAGQPDANRSVGMFYFLWHGANDTHDYKYIHNNHETLTANPTAYNNPSSSVWPAPSHGAYWAKPLFGFYRSEDEWVFRRHMQMLGDAGVDYLVIDTTNYGTYKYQVDLLMRVIEDMQRQGMNPPLISFMTHTNSTKVMDDLYDAFYAPNAPYRHPSTWFYWKGKPLIIGENPSSTVNSFFTFRYAQWPVEAQQPNNGWDWISFINPPRVNYNNLGAKEQMAIAPAQNSGSSAVFSYTAWYNMDNPPSRSRNYHNGAEDNSVNAVMYGHNFQEQWNAAIAQDPETVLVTAFNEWSAGNWSSSSTSPLMFYDLADMRWSRDIEPMEGGFGDNYYMQLVNNIRKYKGIQAPATPTAAKTITINTDFSQWNNVGPEYKDATDDTISRQQVGTDNITYRDSTGRNNIESMKVARDSNTVYFYVKTIANLSSHTSPNWMTLYLNVDGNGTNGWKGYDYVLNRTSPSSVSAATLERSTGGWNWTTASSTISYSVVGNQLMVAVPRSALGSLADPLNIQFKWADNWQSANDIMDFYLHGDTAPYGRLNFIYNTGTLPTQTTSPTPPTPPAKTVQSDGFYKIEDSSFATEYSHDAIWLKATDAGASGGTYTYAYQLNPNPSAYFKPRIHGGFTGNSIRWLTTTSPDGGEAEVFIDGLSQGKVSLYSSTIQKQVPVFQRYVDQGPHLITVKYLLQTGNTYHDAFEYGVGNVHLPAPAPGENLAAKANAFSSTFALGRYFPMNAAQATDDDISTYWRGTTATDDLILDFGRLLTIDQVQLLQSTASGTISQYKVRYWNSATNGWTDVYTSSGNMPASQTVSFAPVTTNKIALKVEAMAGGSGTPSIQEFKAYNTANPGSGTNVATNWEFTNDSNGWGTPGGMSGFGWQNGGRVGGTFNHPDPQLYLANNLNISLANKKALRISMKNSTSSTVGQIYFTTNSDTVFNEAKSKTFAITANTSGYVEYSVDMSGVPGWTGTLKQLRLDPQSGSATGSFSLDYIRLLETASLRTYDFTANAQGWTSGGVLNFGPTPGGVITGTVNYGDPQLYSPNNLKIDITTSKRVRVSLLNMTSSTTATLFFSTDADPTFSAGKSKAITILPNTNRYVDYEIDMTGVAGWTGMLKQLRFDPQEGASSGFFSLDYFKLPPQ